MAGFFGFFDFTKPGPGVPKDAPPKAGIIVFFEVFSRKFWNLVKLNLMFFIFNIPALLIALYISSIYFQGREASEPLADFVFKFTAAAFFMCIPVITVGPAQAGFTYVLRNYSREEHAFLWWDFKENALKNLKESLIISLIDLVVVFLVGWDLYIYGNISKGNMFMTMANGFLIVAFVVYLMMHMYIYPMLVTFKLSVKQLYKNALVFAIIRFLPNLGILLLCTLILAVTLLIYPVIGILLYVLITLSLIGLITNFYVYPVMKKYIMDKVEEQEEANA